MFYISTKQGKRIGTTILFASLLTLQGCFTPKAHKRVLYPSSPTPNKSYKFNNPTSKYPVRQPGMEKTTDGYVGGGCVYFPDTGSSVCNE